MKNKSVKSHFNLKMNSLESADDSNWAKAYVLQSWCAHPSNGLRSRWRCIARYTSVARWMLVQIRFSLDLCGIVRQEANISRIRRFVPDYLLCSQNYDLCHFEPISRCRQLLPILRRCRRLQTRCHLRLICLKFAVSIRYLLSQSNEIAPPIECCANVCAMEDAL